MADSSSEQLALEGEVVERTMVARIGLVVLVATLLATSADLTAAEGEFDLRSALRQQAMAAPATATDADAADVGGGGGDRASYAGKPCPAARH